MKKADLLVEAIVEKSSDQEELIRMMLQAILIRLDEIEDMLHRR